MFESSESLNNQAVTLASKGEFDDAIACLKRAITVEKSNALLWFNLGLTYRDAGKFVKAKEALLEAYKLDDENEEIIETLAILCISANSFDEAIFYLARGLKMNPLNAKFWNTVGVIFFHRADFVVASEMFEKAVSYSPHYYDAIFNLRDTYAELGNLVGVEECGRLLASIKGRTI
jgi:tetratricopeptide (TPR) repeat protein